MDRRQRLLFKTGVVWWKIFSVFFCLFMEMKIWGVAIKIQEFAKTINIPFSYLVEGGSSTNFQISSPQPPRAGSLSLTILRAWSAEISRLLGQSCLMSIPVGRNDLRSLKTSKNKKGYSRMPNCAAHNWGFCDFCKMPISAAHNWIFFNCFTVFTIFYKRWGALL